jgi:hypothetical protein
VSTHDAFVIAQAVGRSLDPTDCAHFRGPNFKETRTATMTRLMACLACDAFPRGIPVEICTGEHDHRLPFKGDRGVRYEPRIETPDHEEWRGSP